MIEYVTGDLFDYPVIGHGVNCVGAMGSGIAVPFKRNFPSMHYTYKQLCDYSMLKPGWFHAWQEVSRDNGNLYYGYNIASQDNLGKNARYDWLQDGVYRAMRHAHNQGFGELTIPRIGAGIGGLEWEQTKPIYERLGAMPTGNFTLRVVSLPGA